MASLGSKNKRSIMLILQQHLWYGVTNTFQTRERRVRKESVQQLECSNQAFAKHEDSAHHKECLFKWLHLTSGTPIDSKQQADARHCLLKIFSSLKYIGQQGLAIRGHDEESGNLKQLLYLRAEDDQILREWMKRSRN